MGQNLREELRRRGVDKEIITSDGTCMVHDRFTPADIAALPAQQQALYKARPLWSVGASIVAVVGGTLGCLALLLRKRAALILLYASLLGVVLQDFGIFVVAGAGRVANPVPLVLQGLVLVISVALIYLGRHAASRVWLT